MSEDIQVCAASSLAQAEELLRQEEVFDLFLLDINLSSKDKSDQSGLMFARKLRERECYAFTPVVMITSVLSLEMESYREIHCYQFLSKPLDRKELETVVGRVLSHKNEGDRAFEVPSLMVKKDGINYKLKCHEIVYIKAAARGVCFCLNQGTSLEVPYLSIRQLKEKLPGNFVQCHRMFVVNRDYVEYFDLVNRIVKMSGHQETVEIGVTYKKMIRELIDG